MVVELAVDDAVAEAVLLALDDADEDPLPLDDADVDAVDDAVEEDELCILPLPSADDCDCDDPEVELSAVDDAVPDPVVEAVVEAVPVEDESDELWLEVDVAFCPDVLELLDASPCAEPLPEACP